LDLPNKELQANVIETLQEACHEPDVAQLIAEYATSLLQSILRLIVDRTASAHTNVGSVIIRIRKQPNRTLQRVRIVALRFLAHMPEFVRYDILHPQKKAVLKALGSLLDDPKRSIRQEAVEARWVGPEMTRDALLIFSFP
jgi:DNA repair/transcription protein MET18/MMS19